MANVLNHIEQGGAVTRVGGTLILEAGATLDVVAGAAVKADGTQAEMVSDVGENLATDADGTAIASAVNGNAAAINDILAALRAIGVIAPSP